MALEKVALVTAGGSGMGAAAARRLAADGFRVAILSSSGKGEALASELGGLGFTGSNRSNDDLKRAVDGVMARWGRIDALVNSAGHGPRAGVLELTDEQWHTGLDVYLMNVIRPTRLVAPHMQAQKSGAIVNISSISALRPRGLTSYTTSKAAIIGLTRAMAVDHGRDNIRVNCICPGPMYTPMVYARGMSEQARAQRARASVLKTEGTGWDVGHAVKFLLSNFARYITGQVLVVDGGVTLQAPERESQDH